MGGVFCIQGYHQQNIFKEHCSHILDTHPIKSDQGSCLLAWNIYGTPKMLYEHHMLITIKMLFEFLSFFLNWSVIALQCCDSFWCIAQWISSACLPAKSLKSCLTLCDPIDYSLLGSSVHGILQARILERVAMLSSRGSSWPRDQTCVSYISCIGRQVLYH